MDCLFDGVNDLRKRRGGRGRSYRYEVLRWWCYRGWLNGDGCRSWWGWLVCGRHSDGYWGWGLDVDSVRRWKGDKGHVSFEVDDFGIEGGCLGRWVGLDLVEV
jgi:hypothetical protein